MLQKLKTVLSKGYQNLKETAIVEVKNIIDFLYFVNRFSEAPLKYKKNNIKVNDWVLLDFRRKYITPDEYYDINKQLVRNNITECLDNSYLKVIAINNSLIKCVCFYNDQRNIITIPNIKNLIKTKNSNDIKKYIKKYLIPEYFHRCGNIAAIQAPTVISRRSIELIKKGSKKTFYSQLQLFLFYTTKNSKGFGTYVLQKLLKYSFFNTYFIYFFMAIFSVLYFNIKHQIIKHE